MHNDVAISVHLCEMNKTGLSTSFLTLPSQPTPSQNTQRHLQPVGKDSQVMLTDGQLCSLGSFQEGSGSTLENAFPISGVIQLVYSELHYFRWAEK